MPTHQQLKDKIHEIQEHDIDKCNICRSMTKVLYWHQTHQQVDPIIETVKNIV